MKLINNRAHGWYVDRACGLPLIVFARGNFRLAQFMPLAGSVFVVAVFGTMHWTHLRSIERVLDHIESSIFIGDDEIEAQAAAREALCRFFR